MYQPFSTALFQSVTVLDSVPSRVGSRASANMPETMSVAASASRALSWLIVTSSGSPVPAVLRPFTVAFAMLASLALLT